MIKEIGASVRNRYKSSRYTIGFFGKIVRSVFPFIYCGQASYKVLVMQILFTFVEALSISSLLAVGIGAAVMVLGFPVLSGIGQTKLIYTVLVMLITRELGPLLTAFIIIARSATAIATEVAGMVISHEVEAFISVGVDPIEHIAVPRFLGVTISVFLLNIYFSAFGLGASWLFARIFTDIPASEYFKNILLNLTISDILYSMIKSVVFGMIIGVISTLQGFSVERASTEVPIAGLKAVGGVFSMCVVMNVIISVIYYII